MIAHIMMHTHTPLIDIPYDRRMLEFSRQLTFEDEEEPQDDEDEDEEEAKTGSVFSKNRRRIDIYYEDFIKVTLTRTLTLTLTIYYEDLIKVMMINF